MAGHNKWSKIKEKKAILDVKKSRSFGKVARLISAESKKASGDVSSPGLRAAIEKGKSINMPSDNIERAVKRGLGTEAATMEEVVYEAYGPGGVAIMAVGLTDNKNRTSAEIRHLLSEQGTSLAQSGSALWAFEKTSEGYVPKTTVPISEADAEKLDVLLEKLEEHEDVQDVFVNAA